MPVKSENGRKHHWIRGLLIILLIPVMLAGGLLLFLTVTEYRPQSTEPARMGGAQSCPPIHQNELRFLTMNTGYASLGRESDFILDGGTSAGQADLPIIQKNMNGIEQIIQKNNADIYMFQEIDWKSSRTKGINQLDEYGEYLPEYQWHYAPNYLCKFVPYPIEKPFGSIDSGVATYTSFQADEGCRIDLPSPFKWPVRTANLKRCMLATWLPIENSNAEVVVINFHLEAYDDGAGKEAQTARLLNMLREEYKKGNYVIAGGDFNQIFPDVKTVVKPTSQWVPGKLDPLPEDMADWKYVYDDSVPTCRLLNEPYDTENELTQFYVIDGFIVSPNVEVKKVQTLNENFQFTDHNPVVMDIILK